MGGVKENWDVPIDKFQVFLKQNILMQYYTPTTLVGLVEVGSTLFLTFLFSNDTEVILKVFWHVSLAVLCETLRYT